jgi:hypothetical protein
VVTVASHFGENSEGGEWQLRGQHVEPIQMPKQNPNSGIQQKHYCPRDFESAPNSKHVAKDEKVPGHNEKHPPKRMFEAAESDDDRAEDDQYGRIGWEKSETPGSWSMFGFRHGI